MDWEKATPLLDAKLDPKNVKKPDGKFGPKGDYIEGWHAIAEANRIFGYGNWSYEIKGLTKDSLEKAKTQRGDEQWQAAYTCIVSLNVGGVTREDVGFGSGFAKQIGDAIEGATKEAVTDALKRALRTFGNPFGLALYDKSRENVGVPFDAQQSFARLNGAIAKMSDEDTLQRFWGQANVKEIYVQLSQAMQDELTAEFNAKLDELTSGNQMAAE